MGIIIVLKAQVKLQSRTKVQAYVISLLIVSFRLMFTFVVFWTAAAQGFLSFFLSLSIYVKVWNAFKIIKNKQKNTDVQPTTF